MKRLSLKWIVGYDENSDPVYKWQSVNVSDSFDQANAQAVIDILDRYSKYTCDSAQVVTTESVGDEL